MDWLTPLFTAVVSGAVTYGILKTELKYLRRDVDHAHARLDVYDNVIFERRKVL